MARTSGAWGILSHLAAADGSGAHGMAGRLLAPRVPIRDLADAVHLLCLLHGAQPGVIEIAASRDAGSSGDWLAEAAAGFAAERGWLIRLAGAVGPLPSTPGQAQTETTVAAQRHALAMLARSDRTGCAPGAAIGLVLDWHELRRVLDHAGERLGLTPPPRAMPGPTVLADAVQAAGATPGTERALLFGAQQVLAQHRGLWDLIEARAGARDRL